MAARAIEISKTCEDREWSIDSFTTGELVFLHHFFMNVQLMIITSCVGYLWRYLARLNLVDATTIADFALLQNCSTPSTFLRSCPNLSATKFG